MLPFYVEAEYESGYKHKEDEQDHSPYVKYSSIFGDIVNDRPVQVHGPLLKFNLHYPSLKKHWTIDWTQLPDDAIPVYGKHLSKQLILGVDDEILGEGEEICTKVEFGYKYIDPETGQPKGQILELIPEE